MIGVDEQDNAGKDFANALSAFRNRDLEPEPDILKAQDNATSFFSASDVLMSVPRGVVGAAKGAYNLADILTFDLLPDWENNPLGASTSTVGSVVEVISEFAVGFLTGSAAISAASKATKLGKVAKAAKWLQGSSVKQQMAKSAVAGGFADLTVFEGDEMRLSNLIESVPGLGNPITEFLATKEDDVDSLTGRLKNVLEGGLVGTVAEGAVRGGVGIYKMARGMAAAADVVRETRLAAEAGKSAEEVFAAREAAIERNKKWLQEVPEASEEYLAGAERKLAEDDAVMSRRRSSQPGSEKLINRVLLDSVRKRAAEQGLDREAAQAIESFVARIGPSLFDGTTLSVRKMQEGAAGAYDFLDDIIAIAKDVYGGGSGDKTFLHEAWHMLSRYMDDSTVQRLGKEYEEAAAKFAKDNGINLEALRGKPSNVSKQVKKLVDEKGINPDEAYAMTSLDEWFVWNMVRATENTAEREGRRGIFWGLKDFVDNLVVSVRGKTAIEDVTDKFFNRGMENRAHRSLMSVYRRSLEQRLARPATAADFRLVDEKAVDDVLAGGEDAATAYSIKLTPEQIKDLDPSIPRNADGSIDEAAFRKTLTQAREDGVVNLMPILRDEGIDRAALEYSELVKSGGLGKPAAISQESQLEGVITRIRQIVGMSPEDIAAQSEMIGKEVTALVGALSEVRARSLEVLQNLIDAKAPEEKIRAAAEAFRAVFAVDSAQRSTLGRVFGLLDNGRLEVIANDPASQKILNEILGDLDVPIIHPNPKPYGPISDKLGKAARTGLDILLELFRNSILSGPRTTTVNVAGNLMGAASFQAERTVGAWVSDRILGRHAADGMDVLASKEGRVLIGYLDHITDLFGMLFGRTPKGPTNAAGRPIAAANAAESWRREGAGVTLADQAWSEGVEVRRGISAQRLGLGTNRVDSAGKPVLDSMGRPIFDPTPAGHFINVMGKIVNLPMAALGVTDEFTSTMISRTNAKEMIRHELRGRLATMSAADVENHIEKTLGQMFDENGRLYGRRAVEERAIKQAVSEGLDPKSAAFKVRVSNLVGYGDAKIGFEAFDPSIDGLARQVERRVREATWKTELSDIANDPLRGFGTKFVANLGKSASTLVRNVPAAGLILPFIRTPTNLITWALNRNPASLVWTGIRNDWYKASPEMQAELMGRLTTGVAFYSFATGLATMGTLTGRGPRDPALRQQLRESGWQPYSIKVGDTYVSYARADPFSTIIGFVADLADAAHKVETGEIDGLTDIAASIVGVSTSVITDKTFVAGLTAMLNAVTRPDLYGEQLIKQYASAVVPNFFAQSLTPFSEELERSRSALDAIMMRIPGWGDDTVDKVRNPLGEPVLREKGPLGNVTDPINPFSISTVKNDPLNQEFIRLGRAVSAPRRTLNGGIDLWDFRNSKGQSAYDRYQELTSEVSIGSKDLRSSLLSMIGQRRYQALPDADVEGMESPRAGLLRSEIGRYRRKAFSRLLEEFPDLARRYQEVKSRGG